MVWVCAGCPLPGVTDVMLGGGLTVRLTAFELANAAPVAVVPHRDTRYTVGAVTRRLAGTWKLTRREVPVTVATPVASALTIGPAPAVAGSRPIVTFPGGMVPAGKLVPVTLIV